MAGILDLLMGRGQQAGGGLLGGGQPMNLMPPSYQAPQQMGAMSRFKSFAQENPWAMASLGLGMMSGRNTSEGLQAGMQGLMAGSQMDMQGRAAKEKQQARNATVEWLKSQAESGKALSPATMKLLEANPSLAAEYAKLTMFPKGETTDDITEYERANKDPAFRQYLEDMKKAGAQNITIGGGKYGTIPPGFELRETPEGARLVPIPGGPAQTEIDAARAQADAKAGMSADKASTMLDAVGNIKKIIKSADTPATGTLSRPFGVYSGSAAGKVRSYVGTLKSGVALSAITRLKEASASGATGFGALSQPELELLINDIGALDPNTTEPDIFMQTLDRIEKRYNRVIEDIKRNVSPERIRELGLEELVNSQSGGAVDWQTYFDGGQ